MTAIKTLQTAPATALAVAAMVLSAACWGSATIMSKAALGAIPPFTLLVIQLSTSVTALWLAAIATRTRFTLDRDGRKAALAGVLEPGLAYVVAVPGLALTSAVNASVIGTGEPALILLLTWLVLKQRPNLSMVLAIAIAMAGVLLVTIPDLKIAGQGELSGDALILLGTLFAAGYVVVSSQYRGDMSPLALAALQQTVGLALAVCVFAVAVLIGAEPIPKVPAASILLIAALSGIVQYALAFWFYLVGLKTLAPSVAGLFLALIPVFGISGAVLFLNEPLMSLQGLGAALVVAAIIVAARS